MVYHHRSPSDSRERRARVKLIKSCDIYLVLILSLFQALPSKVCCLGSGVETTGRLSNSKSTFTTNDSVAQNHQDTQKLPRSNATTTSFQVPLARSSTATKKTLADVRRKIMRRRKDTGDMNTAPLPFPPVEEPTGSESSMTTTAAADGGGLLYGDDYLEDGLELAEAPLDAPSLSLHPANGNALEGGNSTGHSNVVNTPNDIDIERLVRSQVNMAATNFATLRPDEYQAPTFNDSIQGLDLSSYLSNFTHTLGQELDHTIPEESATVRVKHQLENSNLFYPNHNYKYDQDTGASPFKSSKLVEHRKTATTTIDPLTASSDESNKYGLIPRATEQYIPPTNSPLLQPAGELQNYPNQVQRVMKYAPPLRFSGRNKQQTTGSANKIRPLRNDKLIDQQQEQTQIDRPVTVQLAEREQLSKSSGNLSETNVHGSSMDQLISKGFTNDQQTTGDHLAANQHQLAPTSSVQRLPYSRTGFKSVHPNLVYGMMNDKLPNIDSLRTQPSSTPPSAAVKPARKFRRPYKISNGDHSKLLHPLVHPNLLHHNVNGSLAARLLVNRYKNWPLKFANSTTTSTTTTSATPKQLALDSNLQKLLHAHYGLEVPPFVPISPLAKLHSTPDIQLPKIFPWLPTATTTPTSNTKSTILLQPFTEAATSMPMMSSATAKTPAVTTPSSEVMLRSGSLKTNSTKPLSSRAYLRQAPAHHHHHHSHVHSIKPSLISIPISLPAVSKYHHAPGSNYYDSVLAAAAAAASAAHSHKLSRGQQVLAQTLLSQPSPGVPVRLPPKKHQHYLPGTIPIGGTLASTRGHPIGSITKTTHPNPKPASSGASANGNSNSNSDGGGLITTTTYQSGLLAHLLEAANRALKQVAGNTASLLNLQSSTNSHSQPLKASTQAPPTSTTQRGSEFSASDFLEPFESQLETIGLYQAPTDDSSPLSTYLAALLSSTSDLYDQSSGKLKDMAEPIALGGPNLLDWSDFGNQTSDTSEVMLASLGDNSNLLYPILANPEGDSQSGHGLTKSALASLLDSGDQSDNSNPVSSFDSPRHQYWSKPLLSPPPPGQRIIPLKQSNAGVNSSSSSNSNNPNKTLVQTAQSSSKLKSNYQEEDLQNSSHHYPATSGDKKNSQKNGDSGADQQMPYAVQHYIGESPSLEAHKSQTGTRGGETMVYSVIEPEFVHNTNTGFRPVPYHNKRPIRGSGGHKNGELVLSSLNLNAFNGGNLHPLDNLSNQPHVYSFSDHPHGAGKTTLTGDESRKSNSIKSMVAGGDDYRANESKGEEHVVSIVPESSLNPNNKHPDPLELLLHLTSGGLKPHLMAASDIVNYHKLKFIHHYLQHHVHGHDHMSEAARLAVGGHSPKTQLMLAFWPIILAIIPIMIIVAIVVQLVLAAPLVLFAMTTLTVARFVTAVFGPMFSREDISPFSVRSGGTSPRPKLAAVPSNNFLYSMLKMETRPPRYNKTTTTATTTVSPSSTSSRPQRRRRRRRHLLSNSQTEDHLKSNELEDYFESLLS